MEICPICEKRVKDILEHLSIIHNVKSIDEAQKLVERYKEKEKLRKEFREFVEKLNQQLKKGEINGKVFREKVSKWWKEKGEKV